MRAQEQRRVMGDTKTEDAIGWVFLAKNSKVRIRYSQCDDCKKNIHKEKDC